MLQAIRFPRPAFSPTTARAWLQARGYRCSNTLFNVGDRTITVQQEDPSGFSTKTTVTDLDARKGIQAVHAEPKG